MKLRNLFLAVVAGLFALTGCDLFENDKPILGIETTVDRLDLPAEGGSGAIQFSTSQAWTVTLSSGAEEWLTVSPLSGKGSGELTVSAEANVGKSRSAVINLKAGYDIVSIPVEQVGALPSGDGSKERPFTASEARAWILQNLTSGQSTTTKYYVAGKIHKVQTTFEASGNFGNATFFISDDGQPSQEDFEAYQVYYLGHRQWKAGDKDVKEGDDVIVCGPLTLYNSTPETVGKGAAYLYKLNDDTVEVDEQDPTTGESKGDGSAENPFNVAAAINAVKDLTWTANDNYQKVGPFYVVGKVSSIKENFDAVGTNGTQYGNATFDIVDEGATATFTCYRVKYFDNKAWKTGDAPLLAVGDEVVIYSELMNYRGQTPETVANSGYMIRINDTTGGGDTPGGEDEKAAPAGDGSQTSPFNVSAAIDAVAKLTWTSNTDYQKVGPYYVKGKVTSIKENFDAVGSNGTQYGNATFDIVDEGYTATFTCYRVLYFGNKKWESGQEPILKVGDEVVIYAELMNYHGNTPETVANAGYIISINGNTGNGGDTPGGDTVQPSGEGTQNSPFNVAAAAAAVKDLTWTSNSDYQKVGPYYVKGKVSAITQNFDASGEYGNATFDLVDVDGSSTKLVCYRILYLGNQKYVAGTTPLPAVGSEVIICSELMNYRGNTPETVANAGYVYSIDGNTGNGGETPPPSEETLSVSDILALETGTACDSKSSLVVAITTRGFVATDGSKNIYVYTQGTYFNGVANIGDMVKFSGKRDAYSGMPEITTVTNVEVVSSNNQVSYPNPRDITSVVENYTAAEAEYISLTGTLAKSGNYYNLVLDGTEAKQGSIVYPAAYLNADSFDTKKITVTGYFNGLTGSGKYINVITTKIEEVSGGDTPGGDTPGGDENVKTVVFSVAEYASANNWANSEKYTTATVDGVTFEVSGGGNSGKYYTSGNQWRLYQSESAKLSISAGNQKLVSVKVEYASQNTGALLSPDGSVLASDQELALSGASSVVLAVGNTGSATNGQVRITKITAVVK